MFERLAIGAGSDVFGYTAERVAAVLADDEAACRDPELRRRLGEVATEFMALEFTGFRHLTTIERGGMPGPEAGLSKVTLVRAAIAAGDLMADVVGPEALRAESETERVISYMPGLKSAGGTEEILYNTIGERFLGLPPEPRLDKGVPFSELGAMQRQALA